MSIALQLLKVNRSMGGMGWGARPIFQGMPLYIAHAVLESRVFRVTESFRLRWMELGGFTLGYREMGDYR